MSSNTTSQPSPFNNSKLGPNLVRLLSIIYLKTIEKYTLEPLKQAFFLFDHRAKAQLTYYDFCYGLTQLGVNMTDIECLEVFRYLDND